MGCEGSVLFSTDAQKLTYMPKLAAGEWTAAYGWTEPSAGSDAAAIQTRAELAPDGEGYVLNGSKIWITNGGFADVFTVFARTSPAHAGAEPRLTPVILERAHGVQSRPPPREHRIPR